MKIGIFGDRMKEVVGEAIGAYSQAIKYNLPGGGTLIFIAGQIALDKEGKIQGKGDVAKQYEYIMEKFKAILEDSGGNIDNLVKVVHYVVMDPSTPEYWKEIYPKINEIRRKYLKKDFPVSTVVGVGGLVEKDALIEVDAVALIP